MNALKSFFDAVDLIAARLRGPLRWLAGLGIAFQGGIASNAIKVPEGARWDNWVALGSIALAYVTLRGPKEVAALAEAKRLDETPAVKLEDGAKPANGG
jgi:hypothetical protein